MKDDYPTKCTVCGEEKELIRVRGFGMWCEGCVKEKKNSPIELHQIPRGSRIKVALNSGRECFIQFLHLDGLYSYCVLEDGDPDNVVHLSRFTPLKKVEDYYVIVSDQEKNNYHEFLKHEE